MYWYSINMDKPYSRFVNLNGDPVRKTPFSHPYNYDEYVIWKDQNFNIEKSLATYSDRLFQRNYEKYNKCCQEVFQNQSQYFNDRDPKEIEKFLIMYFEKEIKLTAIVQGCNQSNGFPYWVFFYENVINQNSYNHYRNMEIHNDYMKKVLLGTADTMDVIEIK